MNEFAVVVNNDNINQNPIETIEAIAKSGFKKVFIQWYDKPWKCTQEEQLQYIKQVGLQVIFAHLGYQNINSIWETGKIGDDLITRYKKDIEECKKNRYIYGCYALD